MCFLIFLLYEQHVTDNELMTLYQSVVGDGGVPPTPSAIIQPPSQPHTLPPSTDDLPTDAMNPLTTDKPRQNFLKSMFGAKSAPAPANREHKVGDAFAVFTGAKLEDISPLPPSMNQLPTATSQNTMPPAPFHATPIKAINDSDQLFQQVQQRILSYSIPFLSSFPSSRSF